MKTLTTLIIILTAITVNGQKLTKLWEVSELEAPESVVKYKNFYYVSNVAGQPAEKNGQGYISLLDEDGKIVEKKWANGLNAPKGLGIKGKELYIADIDEVVVVDLVSGDVVKKYEAEGATFLNDVTVSPDGAVYISDTFGGNAIYQIKDDTISLWLKDERLDYPNGLLIDGNELLVASWGVVTNPETFATDVPGKLLSVSLKDKSIKDVTGSVGNLDGLVQLKPDTYLASDWIAGKLMTITKEGGKATELIDLNSGSADISLIKEDKLVLVPQMMDGKLAAYQIK